MAGLSKVLGAAEARAYLQESSVSYGCRYETPFQARERLSLFPWSEQPCRDDDPTSGHTFIAGADNEAHSRTLRGNFTLLK